MKLLELSRALKTCNRLLDDAIAAKELFDKEYDSYSLLSHVMFNDDPPNSFWKEWADRVTVLGGVYQDRVQAYVDSVRYLKIKEK